MDSCHHRKKSTGYCDQRVTSKTEVTPVMFCSNYVKYQQRYKPPALPSLRMCWCCRAASVKYPKQMCYAITMLLPQLFLIFQEILFSSTEPKLSRARAHNSSFSAKRGEAVLWNAHREHKYIQYKTIPVNWKLPWWSLNRIYIWNKTWINDGK